MSAFDILTVNGGVRARKQSDQTQWDFQSVRIGSSNLAITEDTGALDFGGVVLKNLAEPVDSQDASTKFYADYKVSSLALDPKESVRAASTQLLQSESTLIGQVFNPLVGVGITPFPTEFIVGTGGAICQTFQVTGSDWEITAATMEVITDGLGPVTNLQGKIYATSGGAPTGSALDTSTGPSGVVGGSWAWETLSFTFNGVTFTAGQTYALVAEIVTGTGTTVAPFGNIGDIYPPGHSYYDSGGGWTLFTADASGFDTDFTLTYDTTVTTGATYSASGGSATTGGFTDAPTVVDNVTLADNDRVLVKDQTDAKQNGIYIAAIAALGAWERATDQDGTPASEVSSGNHTYVEQGDAWGHTDWTLEGDGLLTLNTHDINWGQSGAGALILGAGLYSPATDTAAVGAGAGFTVNADDIDLNVSDNGVILSSGNLALTNLHSNLGLTNTDAGSVEAGDILVRDESDPSNVFKALGTQTDLDHYMNILICNEPSPVATSGTVDTGHLFNLAGQLAAVKSDSSVTYTWSKGDPVYISRAEAGKATNVESAFVPGDRFVRIGTCAGDEGEILGSAVVDTGHEGPGTWSFGVPNSAGQTFTLAATQVIDQVQFHSKKTVGGSGAVECVLYATSAGLPTGGILHTSELVDLDDVSDSVYEWITFDFTGKTLGAGVYAAVVQSVSADPLVGSWQTHYKSPSTYAGGTFIYYSAGWAQSVAYDAAMKIYNSSGTMVPILFAIEEPIVW